MSRAIYIVVPAGRWGPGGMCRMVDYYMTEWREQNRLPPLIACDSTGPVCDLGRVAWWRLWQQPFRFAFTCWQILWARICNRIALVHVHIAERGSVLRKTIIIYLATVLRIPIAAHMHGASFVEFYAKLPRFLQRVVRHALRRPAKLIVLGGAYERYFIDVVGLNPARVAIVHNAVPCIGAVREPQGAVPQLSFVGALIKRKGLSDLLHALARLRHLAWNLKIIGDGEDASWRALADHLDLRERVAFCGWHKSHDVHRELAASHTLILPSHNEGLPMIIIEAMAHGCAVIATPVGSVTDAVEDECTGLLVPMCDPAALARAIERVLLEPGLRDRLGSAARHRYLTEFTVPRMNGQLHAIFHSIIRSHAHDDNEHCADHGLVDS